MKTLFFPIGFYNTVHYFLSMCKTDMQLKLFTDLSLRILTILINNIDQTPVSVDQIASISNASKNHIMKSTVFMRSQGWIIGQKGRSGGFLLHPEAKHLKLGYLVRTLENHTIIDCTHPPCGMLQFGCPLIGFLNEAVESFYQSLDQKTLDDLRFVAAREIGIQLFISGPKNGTE